MIELYMRLGVTVAPDPQGREVTDLIVRAFSNETPFSVIRLGDGEMNILSFGNYDTPQLDRYCFAASVDGRKDTFLLSDTWIIALQEMMLSSVLQADIVGILGLWPKSPIDTEAWVAYFDRDPGG